MTRVLGAILSGGGAARFGSDKLLADVGGEPLIARVVARLSGQVAEVVLLGRPYADLTAIPDRPAPDLGRACRSLGAVRRPTERRRRSCPSPGSVWSRPHAFRHG